MAICHYLTHPEVNIDPKVATPRWGLSDIGRHRLQTAINRGIFNQTEVIVASSEQKAIDATSMISSHLDKEFVIDPNCDENDRTSTGFLSHVEFEQVADLFFERPNQSVRGWETADLAQRRIIAAVQRHVENWDERQILFVGHGAVGTLLKCYIGQRKISRDEDQRRMAAKGGGNIFAFDWAQQALHTDWVSMEDWAAQQQ